MCQYRTRFGSSRGYSSIQNFPDPCFNFSHIKGKILKKRFMSSKNYNLSTEKGTPKNFLNSLWPSEGACLAWRDWQLYSTLYDSSSSVVHTKPQEFMSLLYSRLVRTISRVALVTRKPKSRKVCMAWIVNKTNNMILSMYLVSFKQQIVLKVSMKWNCREYKKNWVQRKAIYTLDRSIGWNEWFMFLINTHITSYYPHIRFTNL